MALDPLAEDLSARCVSKNVIFFQLLQNGSSCLGIIRFARFFSPSRQESFNILNGRKIELVVNKQLMKLIGA